jgi:hypothetical protein
MHAYPRIRVDDDAFLGELRRLAETARFVTSVCTGSLALGVAGLLCGKRAASHWAWRDLPALVGAIPDPGRVVRDGNFVTGGGVTAGIDFALTLVAELVGPETAQAIQLQIEYLPAPPLNAGCPETAPPSVLARVRDLNGISAVRRREAVEAAAADSRRVRRGPRIGTSAEWRPGVCLRKQPASTEPVRVKWSREETAEFTRRVRDIQPENR